MTDSTAPNDEDLLRETIAGDEGAFTILYRRWQGNVYRFALHMTGSAALAEDVTQDVFLTFMQAPERYQAARGPLVSYLYGIARNHVWRTLRRDRPFVPLEDEADGDAPDAGAAAALVRSEAIEWVRRAVLSLPVHYREVVVLCDLHGMSYEQGASVIGCSIGTVRSRLSRGRALLGEKLRPLFHFERLRKSAR